MKAGFESEERGEIKLKWIKRGKVRNGMIFGPRKRGREEGKRKINWEMSPKNGGGATKL